MNILFVNNKFLKIGGITSILKHFSKAVLVIIVSNYCYPFFSTNFLSQILRRTKGRGLSSAKSPQFWDSSENFLKNSQILFIFHVLIAHEEQNFPWHSPPLSPKFMISFRLWVSNSQNSFPVNSVTTFFSRSGILTL